MVVGVGDNGVAGAIHRHTIGILELPVAIAVAAERAEKVAQAVEDLEAGVVGVDDEGVGRALHADTGGKNDLAGTPHIPAPGVDGPPALKNDYPPGTCTG